MVIYKLVDEFRQESPKTVTFVTDWDIFGEEERTVGATFKCMCCTSYTQKKTFRNLAIFPVKQPGREKCWGC